ncbi:hypothetical protein [Phytoactinopolyspora halotolerans]|uniref:Uncharacterized protein n=1 Tax=Phytoactinopolyspora halotolerans TaxID=1981512 RepID=A0A6L9S842_9ACTN|nr:hypothetical protein [Phytoactinopolyspora halotolerans]NEE01207.1 hypothetical protein [Phytoactinopolyspora halotolerans]
MLVLTAVVVLAVAALLYLGTSGDDQVTNGDRRRRPPDPTGGAAVVATPEEADQGPTSHLAAQPAPVDDPAALGRWIAEVVYGIDYRDERDIYVDALWSVSVGANADDAEAARAAFTAEPALAGIVELVPDPDAWERMAAHEQWASFDVAEPVGADDVELDAKLTHAGLSTTMVLVTGRQLIHYIGEDGTPQTHTVRPSLQMLIGCAKQLDGCRLLRVIDRQP